MEILNNSEHLLANGIHIGYAVINGEPKQGELLLRKLAELAGLNSQSLQLLKKESGKPYGRIFNRMIGLSLSHTGQVICCGLNVHGELGIDIESQERKVAKRLRERIIHHNEVDLLTDIDTIRLWTIKEAILKMTGTGLRTAMNKVEIRERKNNNFKASAGDVDLNVNSLEIDNYWLSVAYTSL